MKYEILNKIPVSGSAPEHFFGKQQRDVVWIEFKPSGSEKWYGVFEIGKLIDSIIKIEIIENHLNVLIQGNFYRIDKDQKTDSFQLINSYILDFLEIGKNTDYIFAEQTGISEYRNGKRTFWIEKNFMIEASILGLKDNTIEILADYGEGKEKIKSQLPTIAKNNTGRNFNI